MQGCPVRMCDDSFLHQIKFRRGKEINAENFLPGSKPLGRKEIIADSRTATTNNRIEPRLTASAVVPHIFCVPDPHQLQLRMVAKNLREQRFIQIIEEASVFNPLGVSVLERKIQNATRLKRLCEPS